MNNLNNNKFIRLWNHIHFETICKWRILSMFERQRLEYFLDLQMQSSSQLFNT